MLHLSQITKIYPGNIAALQNINLNIPKGLFGLLGPNGAGKSTLMRILATLQEPDTGSVTFDGINLRKEKNALRQVLGYLPQQFGAYPRTSAVEMLKHFAALKGIHGKKREQVVESLLVKTNLWEARHRSINQFSGGMKQRYGIAQALIGDPKLIIVDEPTAGLDPLERRRFQNILSQLGTEVVVLLSTHIVDDVEDICPQLAIMGQGKILQSGEAKPLINKLKGKLWTIEIEKAELGELQAQYHIISTRFKSGGLEVKMLSDTSPSGAVCAQPTLEDVYFSTLLENNQLVAFD
ncbi:ABC transporter ATP-binding protein [Rhodocytophaga rosea]|uniref:ABC transporter ATP-binding protein n=1 Tax=Rhodocytophaga rosea TaxID=2704465 RepID=A0A6C0GEL3_9BACT|nr:ABC transporter ATP-binding protein [Rhodocytophaga rosea]QHT66213.1 ABC transporter ATP-binding protein [Rhodocytophaga rosea]